ncbi:acyltransferase family protein [Saccharomonospora viridis]|jgi:peptidoglycan/LPS O-acetylase OafA/YrhL|uniref:acyltransferase family protein n=1 Tax=Saccharomonospora viridis TaxID=1852 RepID=UPI0002F1D4BD|nr:acyltransferase [Saccharomonospora viridis]SFO92602.1 Peptidoglycan/LPS O-acetylase OafA/YrhL, contains acyltransferase and SGNH-hydrolase domains [Saccharomonospora viridis]
MAQVQEAGTNSAAVMNSVASSGSATVQPRKTRYISWDVIRVVGILAVLTFHATLLAPLNLPGLDLPPEPLRMDFPFGASVLITVSGYFAAMTIGKHPSLRWWLRRLARLLPAFWVAVLMIFAATQLFAPEGLPRHTYRDLLGNLALVHLIVPDIAYIDLAHWTVPVQVAGFTVIALLAATKSVRGRVATAVMWAVLLVPLAIRYVFMGPGDIVPTWLSVAMDGTGLNRAHLLIAGVAIYRWSKKRMSFTELYLMLIVVLLAHHWHPPANDAVLAYAVALVLICVAAYEPAWNGKLFTRFERQIRWLAGISYGVYLMHYVMGTIVARHLADLGVPWWGWVPAWFVAAIVLGWALTKFVERPAFNALDKLITSRSR